LSAQQKPFAGIVLLGLAFFEEVVGRFLSNADQRILNYPGQKFSPICTHGSKTRRGHAVNNHEQVITDYLGGQRPGIKVFDAA